VIAFVDTETTGLDPDVHEIWEIGLIVDDREYSWQPKVDLGRADARALQIGNFYERAVLETVPATSNRVIAQTFEFLTRGRHLVGAVVSFDEERLRKFLRANDACPAWHYHLVDVEAFAAGALGVEPPWNSEELSRMVGIEPGDFERHTALGDARWAKAIYEAVLGYGMAAKRIEEAE
jgi:DNA polymerase III epsilon subunit-like protein